MCATHIGPIHIYNSQCGLTRLVLLLPTLNDGTRLWHCKRTNGLDATPIYWLAFTESISTGTRESVNKYKNNGWCSPFRQFSHTIACGADSVDVDDLDIHTTKKATRNIRLLTLIQAFYVDMS